MQNTMKYTKIKIILGTAFACLPFISNAQTIAINDTLGGVSVIDYKALTNKNYNTYSLDNLQGYVGGWNGNSLWGMDSYLVLIDGVPRSATTVKPTDIDKVTFLKGAQAVVLYGSRAAKGAILITTKRGEEGNLKIKGRFNTGINVAKSYPKYLGSAEYMTLYNEACANDGKSAQYSDEEIYNYGSGLNPYRYANLDFYSSDYIRKYYQSSNANIEITGGGKRARYYASIDYSHSNDVFKFGEAKNNGTNELDVRGNVDFQINDFITAYANTYVSFYDSKTANGSGNYWSQSATLRPNRINPLIPISYVNSSNSNAQTLLNNSQNIVDGQYFLNGTTIDQTNVFADMCASGHGTYTSRQFQFNAGVNIDLAKVLKGLTFNTQFAVDYATSYNTSYNNTYATFTPSWANYNGTDVITGLTKINNDKMSGVQNISGSANNQTILFSSQFDYQTSINNVHNINAKLIGSGYQVTTSGTYHRTSNVNLGMEVDYNYANRYFAQLGAAVVHSAKLAPGHRDALSPSLTLGWKLKNENFLKDNNAIDELTLSASISQLNTDMDISDYYLYSANYDQSNGSYWGWYDGASERSTNSKRGANEDLTFVKRKEFSVSLQTSLFNHLLTANASFFTNVMDGGLIKSSTAYPSYFSTYYPDASFLPYINYNKDKRTGLDFSMNLNKKIGKIDWSLGLSGTYYTTKATKRDENYADSYQNRTGRPLDAIWGLQSVGFYKDEDDVKNSPTSSFGTCKPGDIKYVDQNNDGVIDSKDEVYLGKGGWYGKPFTLGVNLTAKWKDLTFFVLCTGGFGAKAMKNDSYWWVYGDGKYSEIVRGRWTEATKETATYPRLTTSTSDNNFRSSDFWLYSTDRFDLAKVQITYDLPKKWFNNFFISGVSVYASGSNLLTIAGERKIMEMNVASSPQYRFYNLGLTVSF